MEGTDVQTEPGESGERVIVAVFGGQERAGRAVERLSERDYPLDRVSVLGHAGAVGDDPLGIYYHGVGERMRGWGKLGAFWGGLWGLLTGAAGLFVVPGIGAVLAAGPIAEAIAGGIAGAAAGGGAMAGAAAVSELTVAMRSSGIPEEKIEHLHEAVREGKVVLLLRCHPEECARNRDAVEAGAPLEMDEFPFGSILPRG